MESKKNLNNVQRKMLAQLYTGRLQAKRYEVSAQRSKERDALQNKILNEIANEKDIKKMLELGKQLTALYEANKASMQDRGIEINGLRDYSDSFKLKWGWRHADEDARLKKFDEETRQLDTKFNEAEQLMLIRIYGLDATFEEVEKELQTLLGSL